MQESEATLVTRALSGERTAFEELARAHRPRLVRLAFLMLGDADEAESLAQEALTRAFEHLAEFQAGRPFGPWLHGIALNVCRNALRGRGQGARPAAPDELNRVQAPEGRTQGVLSGILRRETDRLALDAIAQLPVALREAFVLHFVEELDYAQMAAITGVAAGTLRVRAHRARVLLRQNLGDIVDTWMREQGDKAE
jgi:RNA polymerase sigma-70 factor (ECF subfamily)